MYNDGHAHRDEHCSMEVPVSADCYPLMPHMSGGKYLPVAQVIKQDAQRIATSKTRHSCILDCLTSSSVGMSTSVRFLLTDPKMTTPPSKRYSLRGLVLVTITQSLYKGEKYVISSCQKTALLYKRLTANCSRSIYSNSSTFTIWQFTFCQHALVSQPSVWCCGKHSVLSKALQPDQGQTSV